MSTTGRKQSKNLFLDTFFIVRLCKIHKRGGGLVKDVGYGFEALQVVGFGLKWETASKEAR